jgi:predicted nucleic acid-binding Zn ribbon protein
MRRGVGLTIRTGGTTSAHVQLEHAPVAILGRRGVVIVRKLLKRVLVVLDGAQFYLIFYRRLGTDSVAERRGVPGQMLRC